ncbi:drug resistance transporter, EmrB/QacA protein [Arthrobacter sp. Hiyo1]|nr:drug resistance transporter, EmrB/QacA protein [Arthrobacter sp. Hiyo1]
MIVTFFSGPAQSKAIGQWSGWTSAAAIVAPLIGGASVDLLSWRVIFFINVIPAVAVWPILAGLRKSDAATDTSKKIDYLGAFLAMVGLGALSTPSSNKGAWLGQHGGLDAARPRSRRPGPLPGPRGQDP